MSFPKSYRVQGTKRVTRAITLTAESPEEAISYASTLLHNHGSEPFDTIGESDPDDWKAEAVYGSGELIRELAAALADLRRSALELDSVIDDDTGQFDEEVASLKASIKQATRVLRKAEGSGS